MSALETEAAADPGERMLVEALRAGDEAAFADLVDRYGASMLRAARLRVGSQAVAEEVVQETWLRVLRSIDRFEGRSSLRTWIFVILANCASRRARQEGRSIPFAALGDGPGETGPTVSPDQFFPAEHPRWPRCWSSVVDGWAEIPEARLLSVELHQVVQRAMLALPPGQRAVMSLRDVEGCEADEVCRLLDISSENQRVLLHRARARVREAVSRYLGEAGRG